MFFTTGLVPLYKHLPIEQNCWSHWIYDVCLTEGNLSHGATIISLRLQFSLRLHFDRVNAIASNQSLIIFFTCEIWNYPKLFKNCIYGKTGSTWNILNFYIELDNSVSTPKKIKITHQLLFSFQYGLSSNQITCRSSHKRCSVKIWCP